MTSSEKELYFRRAYINSKWENGVRIKISDQGLITKIELNSDCVKTDEVYGTGIPGIPNIHSHSFQRIMAGLSEYKLSQGDDFWTWRELMYRYANQISPANLTAIATQLYIEMVKSGYTGVAEFHYIHRKKGGLHYDNPATLSESIIEAAKTAGINLTLLPVSYMYSGFGQEPLSSEQLRFGNDVENYLELLQLVSKSTSIYENANLGMAFHSLRALSPEAMNEILSEFNRSWPHSPIHIHIAEQTKEVNDCLAWCGKRPVEWLLQNHEVDDRWCLVHATHLTSSEINSLAKSGAIAGLCPTTEANLGDGFFPLKQFLDAGGHIAIGSD
ncbi:MAG: formimidoylglutamate deiminase, partial [Polaribacter sp.]